MSQIPKNNVDSTRSKIDQSDPATWAAPDGHGSYVQFNQDDIYEERKIRIGQYLSDTTSQAATNNSDVTYTGHKNTYSVDLNDNNKESFTGNLPVDTPRGVTNENVLYDGAMRAFEALSSGHSFDTVDKPQDVKGEHNPVDHHEVYSSMFGKVTSSISEGGRWSSLTTGFRDPNESVQIGNHDNYELVNSPDDVLDPKSTEEYWASYFENANSHLEDLRKKFKVSSKSKAPPNTVYSLDRDDVLSEIDSEHLSYPMDRPFSKSFGGPDSSTKYTRLTYGSNNGPTDWFENGRLVGGKYNLYVVLNLLELWLQGVVAANIGNVGQILTLALSEWDAGNGFLLNEKVTSSWENIYQKNPSITDPTALYKGSSGWNQDVYREDVENRATEFAQLYSGGDPSWNQIWNSIKDSASNDVMVAKNYFSYQLQKLGVHVPKNTLTNMRGNLDGTSEIKNVLWAYNLAAFYGIAHLASHIGIHSTMEHRNRGFFENLFRNLEKSRSFYHNYLTRPEYEKWTEGPWQKDLEEWLSYSDKTVRFFNYCVQLGDFVAMTTPGSHITASENKVPLDSMDDHPSLRLAKYRKKGSNESTFSLASLPSLYMVPNNPNLWGGMSQIEKDGSSEGLNQMGPINPFDASISEANQNNSPNSHFVVPTEGHRFSKETVKRIEDDLEAEMMPFYIQDLRTNEIIAFHAFLTDLSDSYNANWSASQGFGRMEAAQIYGGGSRSIGLGFSMVSFNEQDFDEMWYKINKLTTLVYPQWSEGTKMVMPDGELGTPTIIQPFSQVPTASPLCRLRVGDIFTSNYSKQNISRLFGVGSETSLKFKGSENMTKDRYLNNSGINLYNTWRRDRNMPPISHDDILKSPTKVEKWTDNKPVLQVGNDVILRKVSKEKYDYLTMIKQASPTMSPDINTEGFKKFFSSEHNPIIRSFESTAGRGLAVAINSIGFSWKYGDVPWNSEPGSRAPRICEVSLGVIPIHDITPGLDHQGFNRAPIYGVGNIMNNLKGDPHYSNLEYNKKLVEIKNNVENSLRPPKKG